MKLLSTGLRYVALGLATGLGCIYHWLKSEWRPLLFWLVMTAFGIWLAEWLAVYLHLFNLKAGAWFQFWNILAVYTVLALLWLAWQTRKRVLVEEFVDYTNDQSRSDQSKPDQPKLVAKGLATLLVIRLAQLRELYHAVNEQRVIPTSVGINQPLDATINLEDISGFLKGAVSAESKLNLGLIGIPVGTLMALIARFVQGPRIFGSLHKEKGFLILTAQRVGGKHSYSWRVDYPIQFTKTGEQEAYNLDGMVTELAFHVFTDLALKGSVRWRAMLAFSEALKAYRDCLRTPKDRMLNLKQAERKLIETLAEDEKFELAYYNLGVVYTQLNEIKAAQVAFSKAINENPNSWEAYYALALHRFGQKQNDSVIQLCERVITLKPGRVNIAKAYHLKGLAQRQLSEQHYLDSLRIAIKSYEKSVTLSWKALYRAKLRGQGRGDAATEYNIIQQLRELASVCLADLAVAYGYKAKQHSTHVSRSKYVKRWLALIRCSLAFRRAKSLFRQALFLNRSNADYYFELGKIYYEWEKYNQAARELEIASSINPENVEFLAYLALAHAAQHKQEAVEYICKKIIDQAVAEYLCKKIINQAAEASEDEEALEKTTEAYKRLGKTEQSDRVASMKNLLKEINEDVKKDESAIDLLKGKLKRYDSKDQKWEYTQIAIALGRLCLNAKRPGQAEGYFLEAMKELKGSQPQEIRLQGLLLGLLALSLLGRRQYNEALQKAEEALILDPLSSFTRDVLGEVYYKLGEFERAIAARQEALWRQPDAPDIYFHIGLSYLDLALHSRELTRRNAAFQQATLHLRQALDLYKSDQHKQKGAIRYFLGKLHLEWGEYEEAISCFRMTHKLKFSPLSSSFFLGFSYLKNKEYDWSIEHFNTLLKNEIIEALDKDDTQIRIDDGENISLPVILVLVYTGLSLAHAERDGVLNLEKAMNHIEKAENHFLKLDKNDVETVYSVINCSAVKGWILYKQGKYTEAIDSLEHALSLLADAETYWHLALAYESKLKESMDQAEIMRVRLYCKHAQEFDIREEYKQSIEKMLQRLQEYEQPSKNQDGQQVNAQEQKQSEPAINENASTKATK